MGRLLALIFAGLTVGLIAVGTVHGSRTARASTPEGAVQSMFDNAKAHDWQGAYSYVASSSNVDQGGFVRDLTGRNGSLRTYSQLDSVTTRVLHESENEATVRTELKYATAVGASYDTKDLKVVKDEGAWKVQWPAEKEVNVPPQVIPVNYLRWDIVWRGPGDDWGAQNVENPNCRILSMHAVERDGALIIMGEVVNEDTVPAFITVGAVLTDNSGKD
ncbi:MAG TPA: hypothetical protein VF938_00520, partial [Candidatus Angelobacter sp.]